MEISTSQTAPTIETNKRDTMVVGFRTNQSKRKNQILKSDMILYFESDAAYVVLPNAKIRYAGHFYLSSKANSKLTRLRRNGPIHK